MKAILAIPLAALSCQGAAGEHESARQAIAAHGCTTCHEVPGVEGFGGRTGPPLTDMARQAYVAGVVAKTPEALAAFIRDPQAVDPRSAMPDLGIGEEEAEAIARFLLAQGMSR